jgi:hypothetical protein
MRVLDPLEAIEAKHQNGHLVRVAGEAKACIKFFIKQATVRQAGQRIVSRQIAGFSFRNGSCFGFADETTIAANAEDCQRNAQEERNEYGEYDVVRCQIRIALSQLKQTRAKLIDMRQDRSENDAPKESNEIPCGRTAPIEPTGVEYARSLS